jgi:hypothetical protein
VLHPPTISSHQLLIKLLPRATKIELTVAQH